MTGTRLEPTRPFTYEDLEAIPDDGYRREIIDGTLLVTPSPTSGHQRVTGNLFAILRANEAPDTLALAAPLDWRLPDGGSVQPDVFVIRREDFDRAGPVAAQTVPLLVVEVLSPANRAQDLRLKRDRYERLGVPAYWIVDPDVPSLLELRLDNGVYRAEFDGTGEFTTDWPFPVAVSVADLPN